ncbi:hypothetical protein [Brevundimonas vesicularis]|uniref:DUF4175 domain-containing protein n=1 Tax=Brevundimonas vesicularis TaxID=41276 RepID=A0ABU4KQA0_BREVE|nr:hypothetical protein [Brevundimonas vesicularis]MDX2334830.1 hypothetical protein [Brevundimonas vesicularis]
MSRRRHNPRDLTLWAIFRAPIVLFALSLIGLVGALLQDGVWDWVFATLLASPILATGWAVVRSRS